MPLRWFTLLLLLTATFGVAQEPESSDADKPRVAPANTGDYSGLAIPAAIV